MLISSRLIQKDIQFQYMFFFFYVSPDATFEEMLQFA